MWGISAVMRKVFLAAATFHLLLFSGRLEGAKAFSLLDGILGAPEDTVPVHVSHPPGG